MRAASPTPRLTGFCSRTRSWVGIALALAACASHGAATGASTTPAPAPAEAAPRALFPAANVEVLSGLLPPMPRPVTSFGAVGDGQYLYTLGGYRGEPHAYSREGQERELARVALDGQSGWEPLSQLEHGLQGLALVHHQGKLCRVGGSEARNALGATTDMHSVTEAACFDLATRTWSDLPPLPVGRSSHDAAVSDGVLYVVGGWSLHGKPGSGAFQDELLALDLAAPERGWRAIKAPFQRRALGVAELSGKLVVVGGITPDGTPSQRVDIYDPKTQTFSQGPDFPDNAFGVAAESVGDGVVASATSGVVYRFTLGAGSWQPVARLAFPRFFHQLVPASGDQVLALGGISGMHNEGRTAHVERIALSAQGPRVVAWSMAYPGAAKNRQGVFVHGDYVYLFGGNNSLEQHDFEPHNFVDQTLRLHLPSLELAELEPFPAKRQTMQTVSRAREGIALGGFGHDGNKAVSFSDGFAFDFETEHWTPSARLPESRTQFGLAEHDGELWVFGGLNYDPARDGPDAFRHVVHLLHGKAEPGSTLQLSPVALPAPRRAFAGALLGDEYFMLGGMRGGFELVEDCLRYRFSTQSFVPLACPGQARLSGALVPIGDKLYLAGGSIRGSSADGLLVSAQDMVELDPASGAFRSVLAQLPFDSRHMHALAFQDRILLISTHNANGRIQLALIDPTGPATPTAAVAQPDPGVD
jgi:N-acetylneuraminic acid mutarotase